MRNIKVLLLPPKIKVFYFVGKDESQYAYEEMSCEVKALNTDRAVFFELNRHKIERRILKSLLNLAFN